MNYLQPDRLDALAREHALGQLQGGARRRFERLLREQPAAAEALAAWQSRLDSLAASVPPLAPQPAVWQGLQQRLFEPRLFEASPPMPDAAAAAPGSPDSAGRRAGLLAGLLGGALAALGGAALVLRQQPDWLGLEPARTGLPASYVGLLSNREGQPVLLASARRHGRSLTVKLLQPLALAPGQEARLWALPDGGAAPFLVGAVPAQGSSVLALPDSAEQLFFRTQRLALQAESGAPGARPAGTALAAGPCVKLW